MGYTQSQLIVCLITFHILAITVKPNKLSLRLIHRHSIYSPLIHKNQVAPHESRNSTDIDYSKETISRSSVSPDDIRAPVIPMDDGSIFLVNISIGEPPVPQLLAMDTGSQLVWVHCAPCDSCTTNNVFNPKTSSTYTKLYGDSPQCTNFRYYPHRQQDRQSVASTNGYSCSYGIRYEDQSASSGDLALEKFTFATSEGGTAEVPDMVFGCATDTRGSVHDFDGVLGLESPNKYYFTARTGNKFSYCIGNISDTGYAYNQLVLGEGAVVQGASTPMRTEGRHYSVALEGISVGEKKIVQLGFDHSYATIDSGTTYTKLVKSAYEPLLEEVERVVGGLLTRVDVRNADGQLCYLGNFERDLKGFPVVTLHLAEGVGVDLDVEGLFQRTADGSAFCMAVVESRENVIGVRALQYYNVGFDLDAKRVSFQRIDCELLED